MSVERVKPEVINNNDNTLNAEDLDRTKLAFISFGSLCGMGIGFLLSFMVTTGWIKLTLGIGLLFLGFYSIMKALPLLRK